MLKLIPFGLVFCILPESQKQREKIDKARQKMTMNVLKSAEQVQGISPDDFLSLSKFQRIAKHYGYDFELSRIDRRHLSSYCRFMGLSDYGTQYILKNRLAKHMDYLKKDDELLLKEGLDNLNNQELSHAMEERGMRSLKEPDEQMKRALKYWLATSQANPTSQNIPSGLLVFSRMFLLNAKF
ncbi:LETM1-like protein [Sporodiniella umbellata]|nr:LETM1-like protein [Sporodiniella umbellata]